MRHVGAVLLVGLLVGLLGLAACSPEEGESTGETNTTETTVDAVDPDGETTGTTTSRGAEEDDTDDEADDEAAEADEADEADADAVTTGVRAHTEVLVSAESAIGQLPVLLEINSVRRSGRTITLGFSVTNNGDRSWQVADAFQGPSREDVRVGHTLAGIAIIDAVNARRYPVLFDEAGQCACDENLAGRFIDAGETGRFYAVTGAPPPDVTLVDIHIPGFGALTDVPVTD
jgi:hypothetical protein